MSKGNSKNGLRRLAVVVMLYGCLLAGCGQSGPKLVPVTGKVLLDGVPLAGVMVEFQPIEPGRPVLGYTDDEGRFRLRFSRDRWGAVTGPYQVRVAFDHEAGSDQPKPKFIIPKRYNANTELTHDVIDGKNDVEFSLVSDPVSVKAKGQGRQTTLR